VHALPSDVQDVDAPQVMFVVSQIPLQQSVSAVQPSPSAPHSTVPLQVLDVGSQSPLQHSVES
jgi:hypothetical protein